MAAQQGSKAKYIRDLLEKSLELRVPQISAEEFERIFGLKVTAEDVRSLSLGELMIRQLVLKACTGNDRSIQEVLDRLLGKPMQTTENVTRSYNYHDFLIECKMADEAEAKNPRRVLTVGAERAAIAAAAPVDAIVDDIVADLL